MIIETFHFGEVEIDEKSILEFEEGIPGFEDIKKYIILNSSEEETPFQWLQAVEQNYPALAIINPFEVKEDYEFDIDDSTKEMLEIKELSDIAVYTIVVIPEDISKMSTNLKAPIIINISNNKGRQMIMDNSDYQIKHYILDEIIKTNLSKNEEEK